MALGRTVFGVALLLAQVVVAQTEGKRPVVRQGERCESSAECVVTTFSGCCGGCCPSARAMLRAELQRQEQRCAAVDCEQQNCAAVRCASPVPAGGLQALCQAGRCVAVPAVTSPPPPPPPPGGQCRVDSECAIVYPPPQASAACHRSPCGCCPGSEPVARPVAEVERAPRRVEEDRVVPAPPAAPPRGTPFGLSQGNSGGPPAPQCAPCPGPRPARAICVQGRCAVASEVRPLPR